MRMPALSIAVLLGLTACQPESAPAAARAASASAAASAPAAPVTASNWSLPVPDGAAQPDLVLAPDGRLLLSWIETRDKTHTLRLASYTPATGAWSTAHTIATGRDWFVNWADTPHVAVTADGALWAHWLQKSAAATYAYDVALVRSADAGATWSKPVLVNDDGTATEHGFVALWPAAHDRVGIAWLDGRRMAEGATDTDAHAGHGPAAAHGAAPGNLPAGGDPAVPATPMMTLRTARFDAQLRRSDEATLDLSTCDCCQTDVSATARGALLVYRDRTAAEVRDIFAIRHDGARWQPATRVHADQWTMPACPVNGPAVAARGDAALVGWYTAAGNVPTLKLARSDDGGARFAAPVVVDRGEAVQGRVDVALGQDAAWVLWVREDAGGQSLWLARYAPDLSQELQRSEVARLQGRGRATGFPQLVLAGDTAFVSWTDVIARTPRLLGRRYAAAP